MKRVTRSLFFMVLAALAVDRVQATLPPPPDSGLIGLREVTVHISETIDHEIKLYSIGASSPCGDLTGLFTKVGLRVRKAAQPDRPNAGDLFLSIDRETQDQGKNVLYFVSLSLSQDVRLTRDPTRKLSVPSTYQNERYDVVAKSDSQQKACMELRSMLSDFLDLWQGWNQGQ